MSKKRALRLVRRSSLERGRKFGRTKHGLKIGGRCGISSAQRLQPLLGNAVEGTQGEVPNVVAAKIQGECGRGR
jgi:hypothetical protein